MKKKKKHPTSVMICLLAADREGKKDKNGMKVKCSTVNYLVQGL